MRVSGRGLAILVACGVAFTSSAAAAGPFTVRTSALAAPPVAAPEDEAQVEAKFEFQQGTEAYALGNYEKAVEHFERSFEVSHRSALLYNIGMSYSKWYDLSDDVGHLRKARKLFENYLMFLESSQPRDEQAIADAQSQIAGIDERIEAHQSRPGNEPVPNTDDGDKPLVKKGWFWGVVVGGAVLIAGGVTLGIVLSNRDDGFEPELGTIGGGLAPGGRGGIRF